MPWMFCWFDNVCSQLKCGVWTLTSKRVLKREKPWSALPLADNCSSNVWESPQPLPVIQSNKTIRLCTSMNLVCTIHTWGRVSHWSLVVPCPAYLLESALLIHIHLWAGLQLGLPPVHHQYYYTIVLSAMCFEELWIGLQCSVGFRLHCLVGLLGSDVSKEVSLNKSLSTLLSVGSSNRFNRKN